MRALEAEERRLAVELQRRAKSDVVEREHAATASSGEAAVERGIEKLRGDLKRLCPLVGTLSEMTGAEAMAAAEDGGMLRLKGCRPDTLADFLRLIDVAIRELRGRAQALPTAAGNEWLRDFLAHKEINTAPGVLQIRDLEAAAQKQKEQKEAKAVMHGDAIADMGDALAEAA